jgi:hypothetical protein
VNARTGTYKVIGSVDGGDVLGAATAFNPLTSIEYLELATNDTVVLGQRRMTRTGVDVAGVLQSNDNRYCPFDLSRSLS